MSEIILSAHDVCRDFKIGDGSVVSALKHIDIEIEKGKLTILRGRSGSGKTTLINILGALDRPTKGVVDFGGRDITKLSDKKRDDIRRCEMAFVFQSVALMGGLNTATALHIVKLFKDLVAQRGMTIIMTTHDPSMMDIADRVYTLEDGEIIDSR